MKKTILITVAMLALVGKAYADVSFGVSAAITKISATGSEVENGEKTLGSAENTVVIPSLFAEYAFSDTISVGLDYIPMAADVSDKVKKRSDTETSVAGTVTSTTFARSQSAQAELKNHVTLYAHYMLGDSLYLKAGAARVSLDTSESLPTGAKYGNVDIYGGVVGFGAKEGNNRFELTYTDYEDISLSSSVARTDVSVNNKITAELDTLAFKYSYAF